MTIHHDKLAYGKLASMREELDERGIDDLLRAFNGEEMLNVVDENGEQTGDLVGREEAHEKGIRHRTAHVWLYREKNGSVQLLLQKRSEHKDYPGCYDISAAGHLRAGESSLSCALRELGEELGITADEKDLHRCGKRVFCFRGKTKNGRPFMDNQVSDVYLLRCEKEETEFSLDADETEEVRWFFFSDCFEKVKSNGFRHCIYTEELEILRDFLKI